MKFQKVVDTRIDMKYDWLLVLESKEDVIDFHKKALPPKIQLAWNNLTAVAQGKDHVNNGLSHYIYWNIEPGESIFSATCRSLDRVIADKLYYVNKVGKIYQNKFGGYFPHHEYLEVLEEFETDGENILFPEYTYDDILVKQWKDGTHWYAYVGDIWCEDYSGNKKFDTKDRAMEVARYNVHKLNQNMYEFKE